MIKILNQIKYQIVKVWKKYWIFYNLVKITLNASKAKQIFADTFFDVFMNFYDNTTKTDLQTEFREFTICSTVFDKNMDEMHFSTLWNIELNAC